MYDRIRSFGESARRHLQASEVVVCDRDGLLLHSDIADGEKSILTAASLIELSGKTARFFGSAQGTATQVLAGSGEWQCLIRGTGQADHLYVGLRLPRPLEAAEAEILASALTNAAYPVSPLR